MPKLPQVQFRQASVARGLAPRSEVQASRERLALVNQAQQVASEITEADREYRFTRAKARYAEDITAFKREAAKMQPPTRADIIAMGLDDVVDVESKDMFFKSEWYPQALERAMGEAMERHGSDIYSGVDNARFTSDITLANNAILAREIEIAAKESMAEKAAMHVQDEEAALRAGRWAEAATYVDANPFYKESEKRERKAEISALRSSDEIRDDLFAMSEAARATGNVSAISEYADFLRSDEAQEMYDGLTPADLDKMASAYDRVADGIQSDMKANAELGKSQMQAQYLSGLHLAAEAGELTPEMVYSQHGSGWMNPSTVNTSVKILKNSRESGGTSAYPKVLDQKGSENYNELWSDISNPSVGTIDIQARFEQDQYTMPLSQAETLRKAITTRDDPETIKSAITPQQSLERKFEAAGYGGAQYASLRAQASTYLNNQILAYGETVTPELLNKAVDEVFMTSSRMPQVKVDMPWYRWDIKGTNIYEVIEADEDVDIETILGLMTQTGAPHTPEIIKQYYEEYKNR